MQFEAHKQAKDPESQKDIHPISRRKFLKKALGGLTVAAATSKIVKAAEALGVSETLGQQRENFEHLQALLGMHRERILFLKNKFGKAADEILYVVALQELEAQYVKKEFEEGQKSDDRERIIKALARASKNFNRFWSVGAIEKQIADRERREGLNAKVEGFEKLGVPNQEMRIILQESFFGSQAHGKKWLYGNISSIRYEDREEKQAHYMVAGRAPNAGMQSAFAKHERQAIVIYRHESLTVSDRYARIKAIQKIVAHEIAHHQDWATANRLGLSERLYFLEEIAKQFEKRKRGTRYVDRDIPEEYRSQGKSEQELFYRQLKEYWATLAAAYLDDPGWLAADQDEYNLVDRWYRRLTGPQLPLKD